MRMCKNNKDNGGKNYNKQRGSNGNGNKKKFHGNYSKNTNNGNGRETNKFIAEEEDEDVVETKLSGYLFNLVGNTINEVTEVFKISLCIENINVQFEIDTGSNITAISYNDYLKCDTLSKLKLCTSKEQFKSYTGDPIIPKGIIFVKVSYNNVIKELPLYVIPGGATPILGRLWLKELEINLNINNVKENVINENKIIADIILKYGNVFSNKLGLYSFGKCKLELKDEFTPIYCKPRA